MSAFTRLEALPRQASGERYRRFVMCRHGAPLLQGYEAMTFLSRLRGLHAFPALGPCEALLIRPCNAVQTWCMRYAIDVAFIAGDGTLMKLCRSQRGSLSMCWGSVLVLEMAAGTADRLGLRAGQPLSISEQVRR